MLTEEQQLAARAGERRVKIVSAAGSGKTTVLTSRIGWLVDQGADTSSIMAITFTNRAGKQLRDRLPPHCQGATVGTFHSVILRELQSRGHNLNVLKEEEAEATLDRCAAQVGAAVGNVYVKRSRKHYQKLIKAVREGKAKPEPICDLYESELAMNGDIDFDGLLVQGIRLAREGKLAYVKHLLVDEAQDNEPMQWQFVKEMEKYASVTIVGDTGQSLYSFRGATPKEFDELDYTQYNLSQSFRFGSNVANMANGLNATPLRVWSNKPDCQVGFHRALSVKDMVVGLLRSGAAPEDIAVLCRYNNQVEDARAALLTSGIKVTTPVKYIRGVVHDLLIYLASPGSRTSRERVMRWPGNKPSPVEWIASTMSQSSCAMVCRNWLAGKVTVRDVLTSIDPGELYAEHEGLIRDHGHQTLEEYKFDTCEEEWICEGSGVTVGTVHWSKGGEWPIVIVPHVNDGLWPRSEKQLEELRVFYVAITRCIDELHICCDEKPSPFCTTVQKTLLGL